MTIAESRNCNVDDPECWRVQAAAQLQSDGRLQPGTRHRPSVRISTLHSANTGASGGGRFVNKTSGKYNFPLIIIIINSKSHKRKQRLSLVSRTLHNRFTWFNLFVKLVMLCFEDPRESGNFLAVFTVNVLIDYWVTNNFRI